MEKLSAIVLNLLLLISISASTFASIEDLKIFIPNIEELEKTSFKISNSHFFGKSTMSNSLAIIPQGKFMSIDDKAIFSIEDNCILYIKEDGKLIINKDAELTLQKYAVIWNDGTIESHGKALIKGKILGKGTIVNYGDMTTGSPKEKNEL